MSDIWYNSHFYASRGRCQIDPHIHLSRYTLKHIFTWCTSEQTGLKVKYNRSSMIEINGNWDILGVKSLLLSKIRYSTILGFFGRHEIISLSHYSFEKSKVAEKTYDHFTFYDFDPQFLTRNENYGFFRKTAQGYTLPSSIIGFFGFSPWYTGTTCAPWGGIPAVSWDMLGNIALFIDASVKKKEHYGSEEIYDNKAYSKRTIHIFYSRKARFNINFSSSTVFTFYFIAS